MEFDRLLKLVVEKGASDLFITAGKPPSLKINGKLYAASKNGLSPDEARDIVPVSYTHLTLPTKA